MSERGYVAMARSIFEHPLLRGKVFCDTAAWTWLFCEASWAPRKVYRSGRMIDLQRGQLAHSVGYMAREWKWSDKKVRCFLKRWRDDGSITVGTERGGRRGNMPAIITICNYDVYQSKMNERGTQQGVAGASEGQQTYKERKEERTTTVVGEPENVSRPDVSQQAQPDFRNQAAELTNQIYAIFGLNLDFIPPAWMGLQYALEAGLRGNKWNADICRHTAVKMAVTKKPDGFKYLLPAIEKEHREALALLKKLEKSDELPKDQRELALFTTINGNGGQRRGRGLATLAAEAYRSAVANGYKG